MSRSSASELPRFKAKRVHHVFPVASPVNNLSRPAPAPTKRALSTLQDLAQDEPHPPGAAKSLLCQSNIMKHTALSVAMAMRSFRTNLPNAVNPRPSSHAHAHFFASVVLLALVCRRLPLPLRVL